MGKEARPFISIIMVCYNYAHLLYRSLDAIARQSFKDFDFVFVDNGCTDNSAEVILEFGEKNPEINLKIVVVEQNMGPTHGANMGIAAACGEYYMLHDADDWMDDNTLEILVDAARANNADRVIASFRDVDDNGKILQIQSIPENPVYWLFTMQQANLFKGEIFRKNQLKLVDNCSWYDTLLTISFSQYISTAAYVYEPCYNYLVHTDSTSRNKEIYKHLGTTRHSLRTLLSYLKPVYDSAGYQDKVWIEYILITTYYSYIYQYLRDAPLKEKMKLYPMIRDIMREFFPDYLRNPKISMNWKGGRRKYARIIVWCSAMLEKTHLMKLGLTFYHLLSKIYYFQV